MNLFRPLNASGKVVPIVVFIHGGGGTYISYGGSRTWNPLVIKMLDYGAAIASIEYRSFPPGPVANVFPATLHDLRGTIRHLKANADEYGIDPDRIVIAGGSAGGFCSSLIFATNGLSTFHGAVEDIDLEGDVGGNTDQSSTVKAVAIFFPITNTLYQPTDWETELFPNLTRPVGPDANADFRGLFDYQGVLSDDKVSDRVLRDKWEEIKDRYPNYDHQSFKYAKELDLAIACSSEMNLLLRPENTLDLLPPVFIEHGKMDTSVPAWQGQRLMDAYTKRFAGSTTAADDAAVFFLNATAAHGGFQGYITENAAMQFMLEHLGLEK
jgi:acetyl esterase/lipase